MSRDVYPPQSTSKSSALAITPDCIVMFRTSHWDVGKALSTSVGGGDDDDAYAQPCSTLQTLFTGVVTVVRRSFESERTSPRTHVDAHTNATRCCCCGARSASREAKVGLSTNDVPPRNSRNMTRWDQPPSRASRDCEFVYSCILASSSDRPSRHSKRHATIFS